MSRFCLSSDELLHVRALQDDGTMGSENRAFLYGDVGVWKPTGCDTKVRALARSCEAASPDTPFGVVIPRDLLRRIQLGSEPPVDMTSVTNFEGTGFLTLEFRSELDFRAACERFRDRFDSLGLEEVV